MSLYGALFSGVSGLKSQANKLGVISDNVANVNTVGYKGGNGGFETLVTSATSTAAYSPGGVLGNNRLLVSKQGLLQATDSPTDVAISGNGFFVVNQNADASGQVFYTRSGSFRADSTGNFRNASGFYLQAWPLDREGRLPGAAGNTTYTTSSANLNSLQVVNVQNLTGSAAATSAISIGANLKSSESVFAGAAGSIIMDSLSTNNYKIAAKDIIVPSTTNHIARGDKLTVSTGDGLGFTYRYGGFTFSRNIADGTAPDSGATLLAGSTTLGTNPYSFDPGSNVVTVTETAHGLATGAVITLSGNTTNMAGIASSQFNGNFVVTVTDANHYTFKVASSAAAAAAVVSNSATTASTSVTVDVGNTNYTAGQTVTIAGMSTLNGVTLNGTHTITAVNGTEVTWAIPSTTPPTVAAQAFSNPTGDTIRVQVGATNNTWASNDSITIAGADMINDMDPNGTWTVIQVGGTGASSWVEFSGSENSQTPSNLTLAASAITFPADTSDPLVTVDVGSGNGANFNIGDSITLTGGTLNGIAVAGTYTITDVSGDDIEFQLTGTSLGAGAFGAGTETIHQNTAGAATATQFKATGGGAGTAALATAGGTAITSVTRPFAGRILDATNPETRFLGTTGTAGYTTDALTFKITTAATGTVTFSYTSASPDVRQKQFNNLNNLAASINEVAGLSARVVDGQLYVGATDANAAVVFENGSVIGTDGPPVQSGIDWVRELGFQNIDTGTNRFSSMQGLANLATTDSGISASIENPLGASTLNLNVDDPLDTISFADSPTASALAAFTNPTPFSTLLGSNVVTVTHSAPHGFASGDFVTLDASSLAGTHVVGSTTAFNINAATLNPTVTVTVDSSQTRYVVGETITIAGATAYNGIDPNGTWEITAITGDDITFQIDDDQTASATGTGGGLATTAYGSFNGIPLAEFSGRYEVTVTGSTTYTVNLPTDATVSGATGNTGLLVTPHNNLGSLVAELGLAPSLNSAAYTTPLSTSSFGPAYSPTDATLNMASGAISSQFSRPIRIYDAQGGGHDLNVAFLKTDVNTWAIEVYAVPASDVSTSLPNGLVTYGNVVFNGDGTLRSVDTTLSQGSVIAWTNGASTSSVNFGWGTAGQPGVGAADGLSQYNAAYKVSFANQNGAPVGELTGVTITELGVVVASYSNGQTQNLYKIPLADFANPDQLDSSTGNVFAQSSDSGEFNLRQAGTSGVGKIAASSLEASNVELSSELTDMIIAQRSYQANAKVISTSDSMLDQLNQIIR